jgi:hypothetical protein
MHSLYSVVVVVVVVVAAAAAAAAAAAVVITLLFFIIYRSAVSLVDLITQHFPGFRDHAVYKGRQVQSINSTRGGRYSLLIAQGAAGTVY